MGANSMPWTDAINELLSDGEWHATEEALSVGAAAVSDERALHEIGDKRASHSNERRIAIGRRNVAMQSVTGMIRFGKAEYGEGKKKIRLVGHKSRSLGELAPKVDELERVVAKLQDTVEALESQIDFLEKKANGDGPAEQLLNAVGLQAPSN